MNKPVINQQRTTDLQNLPTILHSLPLVLVALISTVGLAFYMPLFDLDEGAFSEATREILRSGNWISTYLNGEPRHDKPILIYWLQAIPVALMGLDAFWFRLPSILCSLLWIYAVYQFSREFFSDYTARISVCILSCSLVASVIFKAATADALLNLLLCMSFFSIYRYAITPEKQQLIRCGIYLGLGFLTKGPVAIILPVLASGLSLWYAGRGRIWIQAILNPVAWVAFLILILPWHIAVYLDQGWGFFQGFYLGHNLSRFNSTMENHGGSVFYYLLLLPILVMPFTRQLCLLLAKLPKTLSRENSRNDRGFLKLFCWTWFLLTLLLFSFSKTQLPHYLLYGLTPLFMLLADQLTHKQANQWDIRLALLCLLALIFLPLAVGFNSDASGSFKQQQATALFDTFITQFGALAVILAITGTLIFYLQKNNRLKQLLMLAGLIMITLNFLLLPLVANVQQKPVQQAAQAAVAFQAWQTDQQQPQSSITAYQINMPSFSVYSDQIVARAQQPKPGQLVFTRNDKLAALQQQIPAAQLTQVFSKHGISLYFFGELNGQNPNIAELDP